MKRWWPALRALVAVAILVALLWRFGADTFVDGLRAVSLESATAALALGVLSTVACALRWRVVAQRLGMALPLRTAIADYYGSTLLNAVLPAGVLGDVHRAVSHGARTGLVGRGVKAVLWERGIGQAVLVVLAVLAGGVHWGFLAAVLAIAAVVAWRADVRLLGSGLAAAAGLSAVAIAGYAALFLVAARAAGVEAPVGEVAVLAAGALLAMAVPLSIGGWGPREAFLAAAFGAAGLRTAVVYGVLALISATPGLLVLIRRASSAPRTRTPGAPAQPRPWQRWPMTARPRLRTPCTPTARS